MEKSYVGGTKFTWNLLFLSIEKLSKKIDHVLSLRIEVFMYLLEWYEKPSVSITFLSSLCVPLFKVSFEAGNRVHKSERDCKQIFSEGEHIKGGIAMNKLKVITKRLPD